MSSSWALLDDKSEHDLHKNRLLAVEERPFKRITKRLAATPSLVATGKPGSDNSKQNARELKEDFALDFATFDSSIVRLQFLQDTNERERERYKENQERILQECQAARDTNTQLREQLEVAMATLAQRKKFDEMAEKITSNRLLRPREEQVVSLAKLEEECRELERESETYSATWKERRDQFNRIMEEGMLLRRQIRDEKEEVDRREGMNEGGGDDDAGGQTPRPEHSTHDSPAGEGDGQPKAEDGGTPHVSASHGGTPAQDGSSLHPGDQISASRTGSRQPSRDPSPGPRENPDEEMEDNAETNTPAEASGTTGDRMEVDA